MEAKLPRNKYKELDEYYKVHGHQKGVTVGAEFDAMSKGMFVDEIQKEMLQFFVDFLDEHIELNKSRMWDASLLESLKINFKSRFMENHNEQSNPPNKET